MSCVIGRHATVAERSCTHEQIVIQHRAPDEIVQLVEDILSPLRSRYVRLSYDEHDEVTANTQAVTHAAFLRCADAARFISRCDTIDTGSL